ncbi:MAG: LemA family protein [Pseudomonadota bacterium]|nr:LemA family protein [Pseudomonadota bacterium]
MQALWDFIVTVFWILLVIAVVMGFIALRKYNRLQALAQNVRAQSSNAQVAISKKLNLVNQLIDLVKSFQESEQLTHLKISQDANSAALAEAYNQSGTVLASIQSLAERFPKLRASEQYHRLVDSVQGCEDDIQAKRQGYNEAVRIYNTERLAIPTVFIARLIGFGNAPYMEFDHSGVQEASSLKTFQTADGERLQELLSQAGSRVAGTSRALAAQAADAGRLLQSKVKEMTENTPAPAGAGLPNNSDTPRYFCLPAGGVPQGPYTRAQIQAMLDKGEITPDTQANELNGNGQWQPLHELLAGHAGPNTTAHT